MGGHHSGQGNNHSAVRIKFNIKTPFVSVQYTLASSTARANTEVLAIGSFTHIITQLSA